jgi:hypothetical protein
MSLKVKMAEEAVALWPVLSQLQERARRLEQEMAALRADLDQVADMLSRPVATYVVDGEEFIFAEADVAAVRARLARPCFNEAAQELALADKLADRGKNLPEAEIRRLLGEEIEAIRAEAIAKGVAIDDPIEAVIDD